MVGKYRKSGIRFVAALAVVAAVSFYLGGYFEERKYGVDFGTILVEHEILMDALEQRTEEKDALEETVALQETQLEAVQDELATIQKEKETLLEENGKLKEGKAVLIRHGLVDVTALDPRINVELRYATTDNFMKKKVYPDNCKALLRIETAMKLLKASERFEKDGYSIKIWDGYRPPAVQEVLWSIMPDPKYVADPRKGSNHSKGSAIDLTLVDRNGNDLAMPTDHDDFSAEAGRSYVGHAEDVKKNLAYLTDVMGQAGFKSVSSEWWHYEDSDAPRYGIIEASFDDFEQ